MADVVIPNLHRRTWATPFPFGAGPHPVEAVGGQGFTSSRGELDFTINNVADGYRFFFTLRGGTGRLPDSPHRNFYYVLDTAVDHLNNPLVVADSAEPNQITIATNVADSGGRTYVFSFFPIFSLRPTIAKTAGAALTGNLIVTVRSCAFGPL
uniref:Uncharacterized protein n=1 Tax=Marseillevirus LCMAC103 TaxID=2506604 RepID=A0A481YWH5_9VIRU|nr:MAG: uncharacterized protein LCMAC103_02140 [Marseillevirus LCMAC103]